MTFRYYNCVPQTPNLNRDVWLSYERVERSLSQTDSLFVLNINLCNGKYIGSGVGVPDVCIKCIFSLTTHKCLLSVVCGNTNVSTSAKLTLAQIDSDYKINLEQFVPFIINF